MCIRDSDKTNKELKPAEVFAVFEDTFVRNRGVFDVPECHFKQLPGGGIEATVTIARGGKTEVVTAEGNGRLNAVSNALQKQFGAFDLTTYEQVALSDGSGAKALSYVGVGKDGKTYWGAGIDEDIIQSSIDALVSACLLYTSRCV